MQASTPSVWAFIVLGVPVAMLMVLFFRMVTAKTSKAAAVNFALAMAVALMLFPVFSSLGLGPTPDEWQEAQSRAPKADELLEALPWEVFLAGAIWIIGGNYIILRQRHKARASWMQGLNPFFPFGRYMNARSRVYLLLLAFISLALAQVGLVRNAHRLPQDVPIIQTKQ